MVLLKLNSKDKMPTTKIPDDVLYVLDGKVTTEENIDKLDPKTIESIDVLKDKTATDKYGVKARGVVKLY